MAPKAVRVRFPAPAPNFFSESRDQDVSLDTTFELASLIEGHMGLKHVRYFVFSRKTSVMQEIKPSWDRWKLSFDGKLERKQY